MPIVLDRIRKITGKDFKFYELDTTDKEALEMVFNENKIDSVIHFAAFKAVGESVAKPLEYYKNNLGNTLTVASQVTEVPWQRPPGVKFVPKLRKESAQRNDVRRK